MTKCEFPSMFHRGKDNWHHPISWAWDCGMYLCEAHHSLILGRKRLYEDESIIETIEELRSRVRVFEKSKVIALGN